MNRGLGHGRPTEPKQTSSKQRTKKGCPNIKRHKSQKLFLGKGGPIVKGLGRARPTEYRTNTLQNKGTKGGPDIEIERRNSSNIPFKKGAPR